LFALSNEQSFIAPQAEVIFLLFVCLFMRACVRACVRIYLCVCEKINNYLCLRVINQNQSTWRWRDT